MVKRENTELGHTAALENEIQLLERVSNVPSRHFLEYFGSSHRTNRISQIEFDVYYTYTEYAPFGNLHELLERAR